MALSGHPVSDELCIIANPADLELLICSCRRATEMTLLTITRRQLAAILSGASVWPITAHAQQGARPTIGYLAGGARERTNLVPFQKGLGEVGLIEGRDF